MSAFQLAFINSASGETGRGQAVVRGGTNHPEAVTIVYTPYPVKKLPNQEVIPSLFMK
jgi:hypothetical protein